MMGNDTIHELADKHDLLTTLTRWEEGHCSKDETVKLCQALVDSGKLPHLDHSIRRTCYILSAVGDVGNLPIPPTLGEILLDPERMFVQNATHH